MKQSFSFYFILPLLVTSIIVQKNASAFFGADIYAQLDYANLGSKDGAAIEERGLAGAGLGVDAYFDLPFIFIGASGELKKYYQLKDPADVGQTNNSGTAINLSALAGFEMSGIRFTGKYIINSSYSFDKQTSDSQDLKYHGPTNSFGLLITILSDGGYFWGINYSNITFEKYDKGSTTTIFNSGSELNLTSYGLVYGLRF